MESNSPRRNLPMSERASNTQGVYSTITNNKNTTSLPYSIYTKESNKAQNNSQDYYINPDMIYSNTARSVTTQSMQSNLNPSQSISYNPTLENYVAPNPKVYTLTPKIPSKIDHREIPRPIDHLKPNLDENGNIQTYYTSEISGPLNNLDSYYIIDDGNASPKFMRTTLYQIPRFADSLENSHFKFGIIVQPFAPTPVGQEVGLIDLNQHLGIHDYDKQYLIRCKSCGSYINSYVLSKLDSNGCVCNFCGTKYNLNYQEIEVLTNLSNESIRNPRILRGSVDFIAPVNYYSKIQNTKKDDNLISGLRTLSLSMIEPYSNNSVVSSARSIPSVRTSMTEPIIHETLDEHHSKPAHIILIDCNNIANKLNLKSTVIEGIKYTLRHEITNGFEHSDFCIITYTNNIQFYSYNYGNKKVYMVSGDEPFPPCPLDNLFLNVEHARETIDEYLDCILNFDPYIDNSKTCGFSAIQVAVQMLVEKACGGTITVFQSEPSAIRLEIENEKTRDDEIKKLLNGTVLQCYESNIAIDIFYCLSCESLVNFPINTYFPVQTGGRFKVYSTFDYRRDYISLYQEIYRSLTTYYAYGCELKLRCSKGLYVKEMLSPFTIPKAIVDKDAIKVPRISPEASIAFIIGMEDIPETRNFVYVQAACLHLNTTGQHCVRVHTMQLSVTNSMSKVYKFADLESIVNIYMRNLAYNALKFEKSIRVEVLDEVIDILSSYRRLCASSTPSNQLILPDSLKLLPPLCMAAFKLIAMHSSNEFTNITSILYNTLNCGVSQTMYIYPKLYSLGRESDFLEGNIKFELIPTSGEHVFSDGMYLLDSGTEVFLYFGVHVPISILKDVFGSLSNDNNWIDVVRLDSYHDSILWTDLEVKKSDLSDKILNCVDQLVEMNKSNSFKRLLIIAPKSRGEHVFKTYLIEDSYKREPSYMNFLCDIHSKIHSKNQIIR